MIPVRELIVGSLGDVVRRQPMSSAKLKFAWETAVGTAIARATEVTVDADGILHVRADSEHWRREIGRSRIVIKRRLAELLGARTIKRLSIQSIQRRRPS